MSTLRRKLVIVGDGGCGKTCLLTVFAKWKFPDEYVPTVFESWVADVQINGQWVELALWDTAGQENYDRLRPLSYPNADVVLICFSVDSPDSLDNVKEAWIAEVMHFCRNIPVVLVGCKTDLRQDPHTIEGLRKTGHTPLAPSEGLAVANKIHASYVECSRDVARVSRRYFRQRPKRRSLESRRRDVGHVRFSRELSIVGRY
ncbi:GTP-binding protein RHO-1 protein [Mycena leptocephala]|nr:GTP-binding protein RHO-1 protein [Mycena leptocephala]